MYYETCGSGECNFSHWTYECLPVYIYIYIFFCKVPTNITFLLHLPRRKLHLLKTVHYVPGLSRWVTDQCTAVTLMAMIVPDTRVRYVDCT